MRSDIRLKLMAFLLGISAVAPVSGQQSQVASQAARQQAQDAVRQQQVNAQQTGAQNDSPQTPDAASPGQAGGQSTTKAPLPNASSTVLQVNTQLVIVDVVVQNKDGHPVHGLTPEMFQVTEDGVPQRIRHFEEHSNLQPVVSGPPIPKLPAGMYTDYTPVAADSTLNILLVDSLNTPAKDQSYVQTQLKDYINHAKPGTRIAIFGLANQLVLLQGFTSDPDTLKNAINHKLIPRYSSLLDDPGGSGVDPETASDAAADGAGAAPPPGTIANSPATSAAANYQQFEAETEALQTQMRLQYTLDAFNGLAHYLAAFPGRKNLIWFSGSFPLNILPDPALGNPFAVASINQDEFRETTNLLAKAQVAVYPVDARGLLSPPTYNAASSGRRLGPNPQGLNAALSTYTSSQSNEHSTMDTLAENTGGHAFYNTNALSSAVSDAIDAGSNYYTVVYTPTDHKEDGGFRKIKITFTGKIPKGPAQLSYRLGYYANDTTQKGTSTRKIISATDPESTGGPAATAAAFQRAAMSRGAPAPEDILFTVRVLPAGTTKETSVAPGNHLTPAVSTKGPFRNYDIDFLALPKDVTLTKNSNGRREGSLEFMVYVFDVDGNLLNTDGSNVSLDLTDHDYASFMQHVMQMHLQVSAPAKGESFLRIGIHDLSANRFGVVEVPISSVDRLPPAVYASAPKTDAGKPASTQPPTAAPPASKPPQ